MGLAHRRERRKVVPSSVVLPFFHLAVGQKIGTQNGPLVNGNMDKNLPSPGGLILTHTQFVCWVASHHNTGTKASLLLPGLLDSQCGSACRCLEPSWEVTVLSLSSLTRRQGVSRVETRRCTLPRLAASALPPECVSHTSEQFDLPTSPTQPMENYNNLTRMKAPLSSIHFLGPVRGLSFFTQNW